MKPAEHPPRTTQRDALRSRRRQSSFAARLLHKHPPAEKLTAPERVLHARPAKADATLRFLTGMAAAYSTLYRARITWGDGSLYEDTELIHAYTSNLFAAFDRPFVAALHTRREKPDELHTHVLSPVPTGALRAALKQYGITVTEVRDDGLQDTSATGLDSAARYMTQWADPRLRPAKLAEGRQFKGAGLAAQYRVGYATREWGRKRHRDATGNPAARLPTTWQRGGVIPATAPSAPAIGLMLAVLSTWVAALNVAVLSQAVIEATGATRRPGKRSPGLLPLSSTRPTHLRVPRPNAPPRARGTAPPLPRLAVPRPDPLT